MGQGGPPTTAATGASWVGGLIAAGISLAGLGALLLAWGLAGERVHLTQANRPVNPGATDPASIVAHNSPALEADPTEPASLAVASRTDSPQPGCAVHVSTDAGATWQPTEMPVPNPTQHSCFAPDIAYGPQGRLYATFVTVAGQPNQPRAIWLASSTDAGSSWSQPHRITQGRPFQPSVTADPTTRGRVHVAWLAATDPGPWGFTATGNPITIARSDDGGETWTEPATVSAEAHQRPLAPTVATAPDGRVAVAYLDLADDRLDYHGTHDGQGGPSYQGSWTLALAHSSNQEATWAHTTISDTIRPARRLVAFFPPTPALALGANDRMHVAFHDARQSPADVWLWTRTGADQGFSAPTRVNDTEQLDATSQYLPQVDLAPDGRLDVVYYDRRGDPDNTFTQVALQSSYDHGETFTPHLHLTSQPFDHRIGPGGERNLATLGSHLGLAATPRHTTAIWTDTRAGTHASGRQDLAAARVTHTSAPTWRPVLLVGGLAGLAAGLYLTARWTARRQRRRGPTSWPRPRQQPAQR